MTTATMEQDIPALAGAARAGDMRAFESLVRLYMKRAYFFTLGLVGDGDDALDISQGAFVKAWRAIGGLEDNAKFPAWLFSILRNEAMNFLDRGQRRKRIERGEQECFIRVCAQEAPGAERNLLCRSVQEALASLPAHMREIIVLKHFQGLGYDEIAALLDIPRGSVASRLYRARAELARQLNGRI